MLNVIKTTQDNIFPEASGKLVSLIINRINAGQKTLVFLSGGSCINIYAKLADGIASKKNIRGKLAFAQVDERFHPGNQVVSRKYKVASKKNNSINAEAINESGLWRICDSQKIPCYLISQLGTLKESANKYNKIISKLFDSFDYKIAVLGIGEDGHTAGLLPGYDKDWNKGRDEGSCVVGYHLRQNNARALFCRREFRQRITVTPKLLKQLDYALVIAVGAKKRKAVEKFLKKDSDTDLNYFPAAIIRNIKDFDLFTDLNL